jgi:hypothetical protein
MRVHQPGKPSRVGLSFGFIAPKFGWKCLSSDSIKGLILGSPSGLAHQLISIGDQLRDAGRDPLAELLYRKALSLHPTYNAHFSLAMFVSNMSFWPFM